MNGITKEKASVIEDTSKWSWHRIASESAWTNIE